MFKKKPFIIGEIASAHEGNYKLAKKIANLALKNGADAIKFQIFNCEKLISKKNPLYKKFKKLEISKFEWLKVLKSFKRDTFLIAETFDSESLKFAKSLDVFKAYKLPSTCLNDKSMLEILTNLKKPVILAAGGSKIEEIRFAFNILKKKLSSIVIMAGFQNFPTRIQDSKLNQITLIKNFFNTKVGYADHVNAEKKLHSFSIPLMAYTLGADVIEKHITFNREKKGTDYYSSLNPKEFKSFVNFMQSSAKAFSKNEWSLSKAEIQYRSFNKKFAVSNFNLGKGIEIKNKDISFKRTNKIGITKDEIKKYIGKKLKRKIFIDEMLSTKDLK